MSDNFDGWLTDGDEVDFIPMTRCKSTLSHISAKSKVSFAKEVNVHDYDEDEGSKSLGRKIRRSFKIKRAGSLMSNVNFENKQPGFGIIHFMTLKIIFWDILISIGDVVSDFMQGTSLIMTPGHHIYGWNRPWSQNTFVYCGLLVLFYPIVPVIAFMALLWHNQNDLDNKQKMEKFRQAEYRAMISHAIAGGIESPVQFVLQIWLILNGIRPLPCSYSRHN
ncbi:unnamed protein product [Lepeophtheirus salmonis]|uniref:(salmon louse) hypothetical protein n=1 Tax=Lepeophtheirus salmonis TaxID=72036 RepID=A0A7R8D9K9_LEPSM|nr:unnamed protein product [Lepeophtheirus salmonis]CAF3046198.1 unnamed protein product [Lepeophtheirus salmonis]